MSQLYVPLLKPEDVIPHLASPTHWKAGHSAQELAYSWFNASGFPCLIQQCLSTDPVFQDATFLNAVFERKTDLGTKGRPSQTDLLAYVDLGQQLGLLAVEGKVEESFDRCVAEWNDGSAGKVARLNALCKTLGLDDRSCGEIRYQLLHRTASAIYEAKRYHIREALMLVHSFSATARWFTEFQAFAEAIGTPVSKKNICSPVALLEGVNLRLAWVSDTAKTNLEADHHG